MTKKAVSPKIDETSIKFYERNFQSINGGVTYVLEAYPMTYEKTLLEIKGIFTKNELLAIIDTFNSHMITNRMAGEELWFSVMEAFKYNYIDQQFDVDRETMSEKIQKLTIFQKAVMETWANGFWYGGDPEENKNFDKYVEHLL